MKRHMVILKGFSVILLMLALCSGMLPFCRVRTGNKTIAMSGVALLNAGRKTGYEHYREGSVPENFVIAQDFTWGELKNQMGHLGHKATVEFFMTGIILVITIVLSKISMYLLIFTRTKGMIVATVLTGLASLLNIFFMLVHNRLCAEVPMLLVPCTGFYAYILLSETAFLILLLLWLTDSHQTKLMKAMDKNRKVRMDRNDFQSVKKTSGENENVFMDYSTMEISRITEILKDVPDKRE